MMNEKDDTLKILGATIKQLREEAGMSLDELAERSGYTSDNKRSSIAKIEAGKSDVPASKLLNIAMALHTTPGALMGMVEKKVDEARVCELMEKCYGAAANQIVQKFLRLDPADRIRIEERINIILEDPKYQEIKSKGDTNTIVSAM